MISNKEVKLITSLSQKKYRNKHLLFVAEGEKLVLELIKAKYTVENIYYTNMFNYDIEEHLALKVSEKDLKRISSLKTPSKVVGVFKIPTYKKTIEGGLQVVLDGIQDPGNLGTIIRLCDWFGVSNLICSLDTVDCYNPKVVQATMGSLARVVISYQDIEDFIINSKSTVFITDMDGENVYEQKLPKDALLVMGNEGNGIRETIKALAKKSITIPRFGENSKAESLNVATATAILLSEFRR
ncbi:MAG TPA: RNA methyltransferase [Lutibacter sp.]|nr:RNA methyltransferase [Lutibacter sp.]